MLGVSQIANIILVFDCDNLTDKLIWKKFASYLQNSSIIFSISSNLASIETFKKLDSADTQSLSNLITISLSGSTEFFKTQYIHN